jgi:hypothetical protein
VADEFLVEPSDDERAAAAADAAAAAASAAADAPLPLPPGPRGPLRALHVTRRPRLAAWAHVVGGWPLAADVAAA